MICCYMIGYSYIFMYPFLNITMRHISSSLYPRWGSPRICVDKLHKSRGVPKGAGKKKPAGQVVIRTWDNVYSDFVMNDKI